MKKTASSRARRFLILPLIAALLCAAFLFSCRHVGTVTQVGAAIGQATGVIGEETAGAIIRSGQAFERAFEDITPEQEYYIGRAVAATILTTYRLQ